MSIEKSEKCREAIKSALGNSAKFFIIECDEILVNDSDSFSVLISIKPDHEIEIEGHIINGGEMKIECLFCDDDEPEMIIGEDTEVCITGQRIFAALYWMEVTEAS